MKTLGMPENANNKQPKTSDAGRAFMEIFDHLYRQPVRSEIGNLLGSLKNPNLLPDQRVVILDEIASHLMFKDPSGNVDPNSRLKRTTREY